MKEFPEAAPAGASKSDGLPDMPVISGASSAKASEPHTSMDATDLDKILANWVNKPNITDDEKLTRERLCRSKDFDSVANNKSTVLYLRDNKLTELPHNTFHFLHNLKELFLDHNNLHELSPKIGDLINLEYLGLGYNNLHELPPAIGNLINLKYLDIDHNNLHELPLELGNLKKLQRLNLTTTWNSASLVRLDVAWVNKHFKTLVDKRNSDVAMERLNTYAEHISDISVIDAEEGGLEGLLKKFEGDNGNVELLRRIMAVSGEVHRIANPYIRIIFDLSDEDAKKKLQNISGVSRSITHKDGIRGEIITGLSTDFEKLRIKYPNLKFGLEIETGIPIATDGGEEWYENLSEILPTEMGIENSRVTVQPKQDQALFDLMRGEVISIDDTVNGTLLHNHDDTYALEQDGKLFPLGANVKLREACVEHLRSRDIYMEEVALEFKPPYYAVERASKILGLPKSFGEQQNVAAVLNDWGAILNDSTGVHVHVGFDHLKTSDLGISKSDKWDQESKKYGDKDVTPYQFFVAKQFIINNLAVDDIISKIAADNGEWPHDLSNFDDVCEKISNAKDFAELYKIVQPKHGRNHTINVNSYASHGTIELRRILTKNSILGMGVDPNIVGRGISFAQQMMATTLDQVKDSLPDNPHKHVNMMPAENVARIAKDYVQEITLFDPIGALNHTVEGLRWKVIDSIVESKDLIAPVVLATINAVQKGGHLPDDDSDGELFIAVLNGKGNWNRQSVLEARAKSGTSSEKRQPLRRKMSTRQLGDIALKELRSRVQQAAGKQATQIESGQSASVESPPELPPRPAASGLPTHSRRDRRIKKPASPLKKLAAEGHMDRMITKLTNSDTAKILKRAMGKVLGRSREGRVG